MLHPNPLPSPCTPLAGNFHETLVPLHHPLRDRRIDLLQLARKKMIDAGHHHKLLLSRQRLHKRFDLSHVAKFVLLSVDEQFRLRAFVQKRKVGIVHRRSQPDALRHAIVFAPDAQSDEASEAESCHEQRYAWKFFREKIERRGDVAALTSSTIVRAPPHS